MILFKVIFLVLFLSLRYTVTRSETDDILVSESPQNSRRLTTSYKFNHPPAAENYAAIPVAIVYEEEIPYKEKSSNTKMSSDTNEERTPKEVVLKPEIDYVTIASTATSSDGVEDIAVKPARNQRKYQQKTKSNVNTESEVQIPVLVVYEEQSDSSKNHKINNVGNRDTIRRRKQNQRRREPTSPTFTTETVKKTQIASNEQITNETEDITKEHKIQTENVTKSGKPRRMRDPVVPIVESENHVYSHTGDFVYSYESGDGTKAFSKGELKSFEDDKTGESVVGGFSYKDKDGTDFSLSYTADENGYRPQGAHLPTPPPIPPAIARALLYLATKTTPEPVTESLPDIK